MQMGSFVPRHEMDPLLTILPPMQDGHCAARQGLVVDALYLWVRQRACGFVSLNFDNRYTVYIFPATWRSRSRQEARQRARRRLEASILPVEKRPGIALAR